MGEGPGAEAGRQGVCPRRAPVSGCRAVEPASAALGQGRRAAEGAGMGAPPQGLELGTGAGAEGPRPERGETSAPVGDAVALGAMRVSLHFPVPGTVPHM